MATINGTSGNDNLRIGAGIIGDTLLGLAGNDILEAGDGAGNNILRGGDGNDTLFAKTNDQLFGDAGDDELNSDIGGSGIKNTLSGGDGNDKLYANRNDNLFGDAGDDELFAGLGGNTLTGGKGRDVFRIASASVPDTANTIADFSAVSDTIRVNLPNVTQLSDLTFTQSGADAIISLKADGKQLAIVQDTLISNLNATNVAVSESTPNNATVNQAPTIAAASFSVDENSVFNTLVGKVVASDPNTGDKLTYAIASGNTDINGNGKNPFAIDIKTGEIKVNDPNDLDFETNPIFNLKITVSDDLSTSSEASVIVNLKNLADPVSTNYNFANLPKLGTTSKSQDIFLGGFSGLAFQGTNATNGNLKFATVTDRGPNGESTVKGRPFYLPDFQPEIVNFELNKTTGGLSIIKRTGLFRADGTTKLTGLPNLQAGANGTAYTDEIGLDLDEKALTNDPFGIDSEGLVIDDNGNYWVVEEYRPAIYQFDVNGKMLNRFIPKGTAASPAGTANDFAAGTFGTEVLPEVYAQRRANRGFEAVALEGNKLYAFIQSAIDNPDTTGDTTSRASRNLRILEFDIVTKTVTGEYLYLLDSISGTGNFRTDKIGDAVSLGNKKFAVVERDDIANSDSNKLIYRIDLANATNINNLAVTFPTGKTTIEQLTESELTTTGIKPVTKNLIVNAAKSGYTGVEKLEGLALVDSNTLALINDNDFNVAGTTTPSKLGLLSLPDALPIALKFKKNDSDIFSVGSGNNPKPSLLFTVNSNGANQVGELGVFIVDDAFGNIDGLAPNVSGYAEKALARAKVILSAINNNPDGFTANGLSRLLEFNDSDKFRFYVINDKATTTSSALANKSFDKVTFSPTTILNFRETSGVNKITFNNLDITIAPSDDNFAIGTGLQDKTEGEVLDLSQGFNTTAFSQVKAEFTVNREAAFNNFIGFYKIENAKGDIKKADGSIVSVSQSGYIQAAVASQISGIDLSVANQSTQTSSGIFKAGSIFAPFIIVNGTRDAILDNNPNNDPAVYFSFLGANTDKVDHVRLLANNTFGFEDLPSGGDFDYNDMIVKVKLTPVA